MVRTDTIETPITDHMSAAERCIKRAFDVAASAFLLLVLSPFILGIALVQKVRRGGPVFYRQERIGYKERPFMILKFRTMDRDYEEDGVPVLTAHTDPDSQPAMDYWLREHHVDELPQLWNILVGDMSFVGPRPERRYFIDQIMEQNSDYQYIYLMRPGATSMATIYNGYTDTMDKMLIRLQMDLDYLQKRSLGTDAKILWTTLCWTLNAKMK